MADLTYACASSFEMYTARKHGKTALVGIGCEHGTPEGPHVPWGVAGALRDDIPIGTIFFAKKVIDINGKTLWEEEPLIKVKDAVGATILGSDILIDDPRERMQIYRELKADIIDMESHKFAKKGSFVGCIRAVSDTPLEPLKLLQHGMKPSGSLAFKKIVGAFLTSPTESRLAAQNGVKALWALHKARLHHVA